MKGYKYSDCDSNNDSDCDSNNDSDTDEKSYKDSDCDSNSDGESGSAFASVKASCICPLEQ